MLPMSVGVFAQDQDLQTAYQDVAPKVIEWRRDIHQHPELSNREFRTAEKVAAHLRDLGIDEVHTGVAHTTARSTSGSSVSRMA